MTVGDLRGILNELPGDMSIIIPVIDEDDANNIFAFRHVRTAGILYDEYEEKGDQRVLCLNAAADARIFLLKSRDVVCEKVLF
jgi:hypothetical protein